MTIRRMIGAAALMLAALAATNLMGMFAAAAAERMVTVPESVWNEILANQRDMQEELRRLRGEVESQTGTVRELQANQEEAGRALETARAGIPDEKTLVRDGKTGVELSISGHVNKGVLFVDSGDEPSPLPAGDQGRSVYVVDNDASSSRIHFEGKARIDSVQTFGAVIEVQFESNSTQDVNQRDDGDSSAGDNHFTKRKIEVYYDNANYGTLWVGQGDTASNTTTEKDLSGTSVLSKSDVDTMAGGISFRMPSGILTTTEVKDVFDNLDGASLKERVRYDTPSYMGTSLATSYINGGDFDVALHHAYKWDILGGTKVAAGVHYLDSHAVGATDFYQVGGSASVLHEPTGLNLMVAAGQRFNEGTAVDERFYYVKGGVLLDLVAIGKTAVAADYYAIGDQIVLGDEGTAYGVYVVQNVDQTATEIYAGLRVYQYEQPGTAFQDVVAGLVGVRQKF